MAELSGVFAASVTPFDRQTGAVDHSWIRGHLAFLRAMGCDGVVPLGTNGEGPSLSVAERLAVVDTVVDAADGLAVVPGTGCASLTDTIELTRAALAAGALSVLVIPPFYFKNVSPQGVLIYYQRLCDGALQPGQQLLLYHFPQMSAVPIADSVVGGLASSHPGCVAGIKDSSGDLDSVLHWNVDFPELKVFAGSDYLASDVYAAGVSGTISAAANITPNLIQAVRRAIQDGQDPSEVQGQLDTVRGWLSDFPMRAATKFLVSFYGNLEPTAVRPPMIELTDQQRRELQALAVQLDIKVARS
ncbi:MAG: dihydrodipicolinate synthase family protein [Chloroflexota bacterium]|nr:dihydrodipicolinate synthase family protein [Chloroflexota bacterium]